MIRIMPAVTIWMVLFNTHPHADQTFASACTAADPDPSGPAIVHVTVTMLVHQVRHALCKRG